MYRLNKHKNGLTIVILSIVFLLAAEGSLMATKPSSEIMEAAQKGFEVFKANDFNLEFCSDEEWRMATLGNGFQIFTVRANRILDFQNGENPSPFHSIVVPTNQWRFFVNVNDKPVALVFVEFFEGKWTAVGIGNAPMAKEMAMMNKTWPESSGFSSRFIRIYEAKADFLQIDRNDETQGYVPFSSAQRALTLDAGSFEGNTLLFESDFVEPLQRIVRNYNISPDISQNEEK